MNRRQALQSMSWSCSVLLNHLTTSQIVAVSLIALWTSLVIAVDYPLLRETQRMTTQLRPTPEAAQRQPTERSAERHDVAKGFVASLPDYDAYPAQLRDLNILADKSGVVVTRADYQYEALTAAPIKRLTMRMATTGAEAQQRRFLQAMLNTFPNLSVARLAYSKAPNDSAKVEQKLEVHLYYRIKAAV